MLFRCASCGQLVESELLNPACDRCSGAVLMERDGGLRLSKGGFEGLPPGVWRYRSVLPSVPTEDIVTLGEGGTPLLRAERLGRELGLRSLLIKDESRNPTGSFMDRGTTVLVSVARARNVAECGCDTTGNLGASLAAYCAKAGIGARIRVNPNTDQGKLYQMLAFGAELKTGPRRLRPGSGLDVTAANPYLLEGEKTTGFEIVQDLEWKTPDVIVVPVGTGGHLSMIWRAIGELRGAGLEDSSCRLVGARLGGQEDLADAPKGANIAAGFPLAELAESEPFFRKEAGRAIEESRGLSVSTTADEAIAATGLLAKTEGIFAEPSAASVVAALARAVEEGQVGGSESIVCVITGAGLKDTRAVSRTAREARRVLPRASSPSPAPKIGETKLTMLGLLRRRPGYAYELWRTLRAERSISTASVYQHLSELEGFSMVRKRGTTVSGGRERILYELTKRGYDFLRMTEKFERGGR